jgi:hypothetical protein
MNALQFTVLVHVLELELELMPSKQIKDQSILEPPASTKAELLSGRVERRVSPKLSITLTVLSQEGSKRELESHESLVFRLSPAQRQKSDNETTN